MCALLCPTYAVLPVDHEEGHTPDTQLLRLTFIGTHLYFFGRLIYLPLYAFGIPYVRSLVWLVALAGMVMVIAALFV